MIESDKKYTAIEAKGRLFHFCVILPGVTDSIPMFQ